MAKQIVFFIVLITSISSFSGSDNLDRTTITTVTNVDLKRYVGKWYAVTSLPQFFSRRCIAQEAVYTLKSAIEIGVRNICIRKSGRKTDIVGNAKVTNTPGVLALRFTSGLAGFFGAKGNYNIIALDSEYRYALIGSADRKSLWLLARTKKIEPSVYDFYVSQAEKLGFDVSKLIDSKF